MSIPITPPVIDSSNPSKHRVVILSGSRAQLRSLWVDEELDTSDVNVAHSASISGNLLVGENESLGGYAEISGSNNEGYLDWPDVSLFVSHSEVVSGSLHVVHDASVSGTLDVGGKVTLEGDLELKGNLKVHGSSSFVDKVEMSSSLFVSGSTLLSGTLEVVSKSTFQDDVDIKENLTVSESLNVSGSAAITGGLDVSQSVWVGEDVDIDGDLRVKGDITGSSNLRILENADIEGDLSVTGSAFIKDGIVVEENGILVQEGGIRVQEGDLTLEDGDLEVSGDTTIHGGLNVDGDVFLGKNLRVTGSVDIQKDLHVTGSAKVSKSLEVDENVTVHGVFKQTDATAKNSFAGDVVIEGNLQVTGQTSHLDVENIFIKDKVIEFASGSKNRNQADGAGWVIQAGGGAPGSETEDVYLTWSVEDNKFHTNAGFDFGDNDIVVNGDVFAKNGHFSENLEVGGDSNFTGDVNITEGNLTVEQGDVDIAEGDLHVAGSTTIDKDLTVGGTTSTEELEVTNDTTIGGDLTVAGDSNLEGDVWIGTEENHSDLHVTGNTEIGENLRVEGSASIGKELKVESSASIGKSLEVGESGSFGGDLDVAGDTRVHDFFADGNITGSGNLSASGDIWGHGGYFENDLEVGNDITAQGDISGSFIYGDGRYLINCSASIVSSSTYRLEVNLSGCPDCACPEVVTHPFHTMDVFVDVYEWDNEPGGSATQVYPKIQVINDSEVRICSDRDLHGYAIIADAGHLISGSIQWQEDTKYSIQFENVEKDKTYRFNHGLGTDEIVVEVWAETTVNPLMGKQLVQIIPEYIAIEDPNCINVLFGSDIALGRIVVTRTGGLVKQIDGVLESSTIVDQVNSAAAGSYRDVVHGFDTENVLVEVFKKDGETSYLYSASKVEILDENTIRVHFSEAFTGHIVVGKSGHIVAGTVNLYEHGIHYGKHGNWEAESFTAEYLEGEKIKAGEGVDTPRVGDWTSQNEYQDEKVGFGSFIDFSDEQGLEFYVAEKNTPSPKVGQLTHGGDLFLKGGIYPDHIFTTSDITRKSDLVPIDSQKVLKDLEKLQGYRFKFKNTNEPSIGVIAQDVQLVYPELVKAVAGLTQEDSHLVVNYEGLVAVLLEAVKGLLQRVSELEKRDK